MAIDKNNDLNQPEQEQSQIKHHVQEPQGGSSTNSSPVQSKSDRKKKWLIVAIVSVVGVAVIAYAYLYLTTLVFVKRPDVNTLQPVYGIEVATKFESPRALVEKASADLGGIVRLATVNGYVGLDEQGVDVYKLPYYAVSGSPFKNLPSEGSGVAYKGDSSQSEINYTKLFNFFKLNNFKILTSTINEESFITNSAKVPFTNYAVYESKEMVCSIWQADVSSILTPGDNLVSVGCADVANYKTAADDLSPFYDSYAKANPKHSDNILLGSPEVFNSTGGYKFATLYQEDERGPSSPAASNFIGLYYQAPGSSKWKFFNSQSAASDGKPLQCSAYNTPELKKAFSGNSCYDDAARKNATVQ